MKYSFKNRLSVYLKKNGRNAEVIVRDDLYSVLLTGFYIPNKEVKSVLFKIERHENLWNAFLSQCNPVVWYVDGSPVTYYDAYGKYKISYFDWLCQYKFDINKY